MIPVWGTGAVLAAPPAALLVSGYSPGNTLPSQYWNFLFFHISKEFANVLTAAGIAQNAGVDTQLRDAIKAIGGSSWTILTSGSPYTVPLASMNYGILATTNPFVMNLPATTGSGTKIRIVDYSGLATGLVQMAPNGGDNIGAAGNVSVYLQNVDQSGFVYKYQWIELTDTVAGTWDVTGGQFCPHQSVDTDGQQYHLGKLHHLPLGNTTSRQIVAIGTVPPNLGAWSAAITGAGIVGIPSGAKAIRVVVHLAPYGSGAGYVVLQVCFSDNNSNVPAAYTAHPGVFLYGYVAGAGNIIQNSYEIDIPLNASGQFYMYTEQAGGVTIGNCAINIRAIGYYMGD